MFCYKCGSQIPDDSAFCNVCGAKVVAVNQSAEALDQTESLKNVGPKPANQNVAPKITPVTPVNTQYNYQSTSQTTTNSSYGTANKAKRKGDTSMRSAILGSIAIIAFVAIMYSWTTSSNDKSSNKRSTTASYNGTSVPIYPTTSSARVTEAPATRTPRVTEAPTTRATTQAPTTTQAPNPVDVNDFSNIFPYAFSNTKDNFVALVLNSGYTELPTLNHSYAFSTVSEDLLSQAGSILLDSERKSYYLDFTALGDLQTVVIRYNTTEDLSKAVDQKYGPSENGEYLGHIGNKAVSLIVYRKELMGIENWEISISTKHQR